MRCTECGAVAEVEAHFAGGPWQAFLFEDPDDPGNPVLVIYCPSCYERESNGEPRDC